MLRKLCLAAGLTLALGAPVSAEEIGGSVGLGISGSASGSGLGLGADLKGRIGVTPPEASGAISGSGEAAGSLAHSDGVSTSMENEISGSAAVGASSSLGASGSVSGGVEASASGEASGSIE
jgi:hypothetical protein